MAEQRQRPGERTKIRTIQVRPIPAGDARQRPAGPGVPPRSPRQVEAPPEVVLWGRCGLVPVASAGEDRSA